MDPASAPARPSRPLRWVALIVVAVAVVFGRASAFAFVTFDDEFHLVDNPYLHPFTAASAAALWRRPYAGLYVPATFTAWGAIARFATVPGPAGPTLDPAPFHLANVALHAANAVLAWTILRRLVGADGPAAVGALLFALHPLQAEPVAWASGFKDTFSGFWSLLAVTLVLRRRYPAATVAYAVALAAKPAAVVVPLIAWLLAWAETQPNRDGATTRRPDEPRLTAISVRRFVEPSRFTLLFWVALAVPILWATRRQQADATLMTWNPPWVRPVVAADALATYARHLVWPVGLAVDYGRTPRWVWDHAGAVLAVVAVTAVIVAAGLWAGRRHRAAWAGAGVLVVGLGPVLGLVPFTYQQFSTVADRYAYLPTLGVGLIAAVVVRGRRVMPVATVTLLVLSALTWAQVGTWRDTTTLFRQALAVNPDSALAYNGLGVVAERADDLPAAERADRRAADLDPTEPKYQLAESRLLAKAGRPAEARVYRARFLIAAARRVLAADPDSAVGHASLAEGYALTGRPADAAVERAAAARSRAAGHVERASPAQGR